MGTDTDGNPVVENRERLLTPTTYAAVMSYELSLKAVALEETGDVEYP